MRWSVWKKFAIKKGFYGNALPQYYGPAIYQLGVGSPEGGVVSEKYLGRADNLHDRISQYARHGSHLWKDVINPSLNRGYALYYRFYRADTPKKVRELEKKHLAVRNYDWNIQNNLK